MCEHKGDRSLTVERFVDIQEISVILGVPKSWVYQRTRLGPSAIPFIKLGKYLRFDPTEVISFFRQNGKFRSDGVS